MTVDPRTQVHTTDLSASDFAIKDGLIVSTQGFAGPFQILEGTIAEYVNQSGKPEVVWLGGTATEPSCVWVVFPDGTYIKIKIQLPGDATFCEAVASCIVADLAKGTGTDDKYYLTELAGPTWQVVSVTHGEAATVVDFSADDGLSLVELLTALNASSNLPVGWSWVITSGVLTLKVPHGTIISSILLPGGIEITDGPDVVGTEPSILTPAILGSMVNPLDDFIAAQTEAIDLFMLQYQDILDDFTGQLANVVGAGVGDTEAEIETEFAAFVATTVRWVDADGDQRVSYKDAINGWYHPVVSKKISGISFTYDFAPGGDVGDPTGENTDINDVFVQAATAPLTSIVPANAKSVLFVLEVAAFSTASAATPVSFIVAADDAGTSSSGATVSGNFTSTELNSMTVARFRQEFKTIGGRSISMNSSIKKPIGYKMTISVYPVSWSR